MAFILGVGNGFFDLDDDLPRVQIILPVLCEKLFPMCHVSIHHKYFRPFYIDIVVTFEIFLVWVFAAVEAWLFALTIHSSYLYENS